MKLLRVSRPAISRFAGGDLLAVIAFVLLGEFSHGVLPWTVPVLVAETTATFLVGWVVVAPLGWAYQASNRSSTRGAVGTALVAWVGAAAVANLLRSTSVVDGNASVSFYVVSVLSGGAILGVWRFLRIQTTKS